MADVIDEFLAKRLGLSTKKENPAIAFAQQSGIGLPQTLPEAPVTHPQYPMSPIDPDAASQDYINNLIGLLPPTQQQVNPEVARLQNTLGMAESLKQRSGDDIPKESNKDTESEEPEDLSLNNLQRMKAAPAQTDYLKALLDAQNQAKSMGAYQMMGKGAERAGAALARVKHDPNYLDEMTPLINQPITNVINQQKMESAGLDEQIKRRQVALLQDKDDPGSEASGIYRKVLEDSFPDIFENVDTSKLSATQMETVFPPLKSFAEAQIALQTRKDIAETKRLDNQDKQAKRDTEKQNTAYSEMSVKSLGTRAPANVQLALKNSLFIQNARGLLNQYPDLNKMPQEQVNTLTSELARIAGGGVATGHGMKALSSDTFNSQFNHLLSRASNKPTGAELGKFLKNNINYLDELDKVQNGVVNEFHKGMFNSYKDKLRPEQQERYMAEHPGAFAENPSAPQGQVKIKRKSDGAIKTLSSQDATDFLKDPGYELVK